jgi:hypothetical protein
MSRVIIPKNSWVDIKALLSLSDDTFYPTSNQGNSVLQIVTDQVAGSAPSQTPYSIGVKQYETGIVSWLSHSSSAGNGTWVYSHDKEGQLEVGS